MFAGCFLNFTIRIRENIMSESIARSISIMAIAFPMFAASAFSDDAPEISVGEREIVATKERRDALGLKWFIDGNLGVIRRGNEVLMYGANGSRPVRVTGTVDNPFRTIESVKISTDAEHFQYLAGGPIYLDPESGRIFLFYHAEIHRGGARNFFSVIGLAIQTDEDGLEFRDLGTIFASNLSAEEAERVVEVCGSPYVIKDGYFYVYARDAMRDGAQRNVNLAVARARVSEVVEAGLEGKSAQWMKYFDGEFSEPAIGGKSTPLELGNPNTRWMDVGYSSVLGKFIMVVAANTAPERVDLFITWSDDGVNWAGRIRLTDDGGESFYPSIVGFSDDPRKAGKEFYIYYTFSEKGGWERWEDAEIVRQRVLVGN